MNLKKKDIFAFIFFAIFSPLFFYNLGGFSLIDFDEAWYGEIARNILVTHQPFLLTFNQQPYSDHPPIGFILMAVSFLIFGINEFSARFPSAILGFASVIVTYLIGKNLFNKAVGIGAGVMLLSSVWFILRARSGNLDTIFMFFYLLTFYCAVKVKNSHKWIYAAVASFALVNLTKSAIGLTLVIPIIFLFRMYRVNLKIKEIIISAIIFLIILAPWIIINYRDFGFGFLKHVYDVGFRPQARMKPNLAEIGSSLTFLYLHFGIREWFYPSLISLFGSLVFVLKNRLLIPIYIWFLILITGFLTNAKTEIWHLLPLYPILGLLIAFLLFQLSVLFIEKLFKVSGKKNMKLASVITIISFIVFGSKQIYEFRNEVKLFDRDTSGLAATARAARYEVGNLYLDGEFFLPGAVFYSQKTVILAKSQGPPLNSLKGIVEYNQKPFLLLTEQWRLNQDKIDKNKYEVISEHKGYVLIRVEN